MKQPQFFETIFETHFRVVKYMSRMMYSVLLKCADDSQHMKVYLPDIMASWVTGEQWIPRNMQLNRLSFRSVQHKNLAAACEGFDTSKL